MSRGTVAKVQRYTADSPCPVCGGHERLPRGKGERCVGFLSDDGQWARCTREECAGGLSLDEKTAPATYAHKLEGQCRCGEIHSPAADLPRKRTKRTPQKRIVEKYPYHDETGQHLSNVIRYDPKGFSQEKPDGTPNLDGVRRVLYRLPELLAADERAPVLIVEGEKAVNRLRALDFTATCSPGGAGKWKAVYSDSLRNRSCYVLPDNDDEGLKHAQKVSASLRDIAKQVALVKLPSLPNKGDVVDWLDAGGTREELLRLCSKAFPLLPEIRSYTAAQLMREEIKPPSWAVTGLIPSGFCLLCGRPKVGKSFFALQLCLCASTGEAFLEDDSLQTTQSGVLLLALEDSRWRMQKRIRYLYGDEAPEALTISHDVYKFGAGFEEALERKLDANPNTGLVVVDTLAKVRTYSRRVTNAYLEDYEIGSYFQRLAIDRGLAICALHHLRKGESDDPLELISGTFGLSGAADTALVLKRNRHKSEGELHCVGRDIEDRELAVRLEDKGRWICLGDAQAHRSATAENLVLEVMDSAKRPLKAGEIAERGEMKLGTVKSALSRLSKSDLVLSKGDGTWITKDG